MNGLTTYQDSTRRETMKGDRKRKRAVPRNTWPDQRKRKRKKRRK